MIFSPTEQLSKILQTTDVTLQDAQTAVAVTQRFIQRQRSHDEFQKNFHISDRGLQGFDKNSLVAKTTETASKTWQKQQ